MIRSRFALLASFAVLALASCHKSKDGSYAVDQSRDGTTTTVKTADGTAVIHAGGGTEAAMPAGLPLYPGATITSDTMISKDSGKTAGVVTFQSAAAPDALTAFYKDAAIKAGYTIENEMKAGDAQLLAGKKPGGDSFHFNVSREGSVSTVTMLTGGEG
jgi:spermidine/putrescine-binding protein